MSDKGWISLHRKIQDNILWQDKPFSKGQAWIDILLNVNHKEKKVLIGNQIIKVGIGEKITSLRQLGERWGWSRTKVKNFLNLLQNENMISYKSDSKKTFIKVLNYRDYQNLEIQENDTRVTQKRQSSDTKVTQKNTNNNDNNDNNDNKKDIIYSPATQDDASEKIPYKEIVSYLNMRTGSQYRHTTKKTRELIRARWNEGFRLEDFKTVIDKKCVEWIGTEWEKFLRPETLFRAGKFESYLNQPVHRKTSKEEKVDDVMNELFWKFKEEEENEKK